MSLISHYDDEFEDWEEDPEVYEESDPFAEDDDDYKDYDDWDEDEYPERDLLGC